MPSCGEHGGIATNRTTEANLQAQILSDLARSNGSDLEQPIDSVLAITKQGKRASLSVVRRCSALIQDRR